jgi:hypothetical protein
LTLQAYSDPAEGRNTVTEPVIVQIVSIVGSGVCVAAEDGEKVYQVIREALEKGENVTLSFKGIEDLTSVFLNAAIGPLYGQFSEEFLKTHMNPPRDASQQDLDTLKRCVERAKEYYRDPERFQSAEAEVFGDD